MKDHTITVLRSIEWLMTRAINESESRTDDMAEYRQMRQDITKAISDNKKVAPMQSTCPHCTAPVTRQDMLGVVLFKCGSGIDEAGFHATGTCMVNALKYDAAAIKRIQRNSRIIDDPNDELFKAVVDIICARLKDAGLMGHQDSVILAVERLIAQRNEFADLLESAREIARRCGHQTAWKRFDERIALAGVGNVTPRTFRILPGDDYETIENK